MGGGTKFLPQSTQEKNSGILLYPELVNNCKVCIIFIPISADLTDKSFWVGAYVSLFIARVDPKMMILTGFRLIPSNIELSLSFMNR